MFLVLHVTATRSAPVCAYFTARQYRARSHVLSLLGDPIHLGLDPLSRPFCLALHNVPVMNGPVSRRLANSRLAVLQLATPLGEFTTLFAGYTTKWARGAKYRIKGQRIRNCVFSRCYEKSTKRNQLVAPYLDVVVVSVAIGQRSGGRHHAVAAAILCRPHAATDTQTQVTYNVRTLPALYICLNLNIQQHSFM